MRFLALRFDNRGYSIPAALVLVGILGVVALGLQSVSPLSLTQGQVAAAGDAQEKQCEPGHDYVVLGPGQIYYYDDHKTIGKKEDQCRGDEKCKQQWKCSTYYCVLPSGPEEKPQCVKAVKPFNLGDAVGTDAGKRLAALQFTLQAPGLSSEQQQALARGLGLDLGADNQVISDAFTSQAEGVKDDLSQVSSERTSLYMELNRLAGYCSESPADSSMTCAEATTIRTQYESEDAALAQKQATLIAQLGKLEQTQVALAPEKPVLPGVRDEIPDTGSRPQVSGFGNQGGNGSAQSAEKPWYEKWVTEPAKNAWEKVKDWWNGGSGQAVAGSLSGEFGDLTGTPNTSTGLATQIQELTDTCARPGECGPVEFKKLEDLKIQQTLLGENQPNKVDANKVDRTSSDAGRTALQRASDKDLADLKQRVKADLSQYDEARKSGAYGKSVAPYELQLRDDLQRIEAEERRRAELKNGAQSPQTNNGDRGTPVTTQDSGCADIPVLPGQPCVPESSAPPIVGGPGQPGVPSTSSGNAGACDCASLERVYRVTGGAGSCRDTAAIQRCITASSVGAGMSMPDISSLLGGLMKGMGGGGGGSGKGSAPVGNQTPQDRGTCNAQYLCANNQLYYRNDRCVDQPIQSCQYGCQGNTCAANPDSGGGGTNPTAPTATLSCQPTLADVGMAVAISYSCSAGVSVGRGFDTGGAQSGSATKVTDNPPTGATSVTYGVTCSNQGLTGSAQCTIQINKPSIVLVANPKAVQSGKESLIGWVTAGMQSCVVSSPEQSDFTSRNASNTSVSGVATTSPVTAATNIVLTCQTLAGGTRVASTTVTVQ